jgi:hypothetical protein
VFTTDSERRRAVEKLTIRGSNFEVAGSTFFSYRLSDLTSSKDLTRAGSTEALWLGAAWQDGPSGSLGKGSLSRCESVDHQTLPR